VAICILATGLVEVIKALRYLGPDKNRRAMIYFPARRALLRAAFATGVLLVLFSLRIPRVGASVLEKNLQRVSATPASDQSVREATRLLAGANAAQIPISSATLEHVASRFADAEKDNPGSWDVVQASTDYRSSLNAISAPSTQSFRPLEHLDWDFQMDMAFTAGIPVHAQLKSAGLVPAEGAAVAEKLENHLNPRATFGPKFLGADGISVQLDGFRLKHVILTNGTIYYNGGSLELQEVFFVNCNFHIASEPQGKALAKAILLSTPVTFTYPSF
jgi:hypothetical protein